jgi:hypothetical protein
MLSAADEKIRRLGQNQKRKQMEMLAFERDMAQALQSRERWVQASAKFLAFEAGHLAKQSAESAWQAVRRAFKIGSE